MKSAEERVITAIAGEMQDAARAKCSAKNSSPVSLTTL
jgi:hypothetical protein